MIKNTKDKLKIIFLGTPDIASYILEQMIKAGYAPVLVVTKEDTQSGRGMKLQASAVKQVAIAHNLLLAQASSLKKNPEVVQQMINIQPDFMIVVAYGCILSQAVLDIPRYDCINVHASLLPKWRGAAPIQRSLLAGDSEAGVTIMKMDVGLDTGDMLLQKSIPIDTKETHGSLYEKMKIVGVEALIEYLQTWQDIIPQKQKEEEVIYAEKIQKSEAIIDFSLPAHEVDLHIRGFNPPGAFTYLDGVLYKIWEAEVCKTEVCDFDSNLKSIVVGQVIKADSEALIVACGLYKNKQTYIKLQTLQIAGKSRQNYAQIVSNNSLLNKIFVG